MTRRTTGHRWVRDARLAVYVAGLLVVFSGSAMSQQDAQKRGPGGRDENSEGSGGGPSSAWHVVTTVKVQCPTEETAAILSDHSIQFSLPAPVWSEPALHFQVRRISTIRSVRLELLPDKRFQDGRMGRLNGPLLLFEVKPMFLPPEGEPRYLEWATCRREGDASEENLESLTDYATDTGWEVPRPDAPPDAVVLVLTLREPLEIGPRDQLVLQLDTGGDGELDVLSRVRVAFSDRTMPGVAGE